MSNTPSILASLKDRREQIAAENTLVRSIPRWTDPEIFVRFAPADHEVLRKMGTRADKAPPKQRARVEVEATADLLARHCVEVWARVNGESYSLNPDDRDGPRTTFDSDLGRALGLGEEATAREVVQKLYFTDGDILQHGQLLAKFSGYDVADEELEGE